MLKLADLNGESQRLFNDFANSIRIKNEDDFDLYKLTNDIKIQNAFDEEEFNDMCFKDSTNYMSYAKKEKHETFLRDCIDLMLNEGLFEATKKSNKVLEWTEPEKMNETIDFQLSDKPISHTELQKLLAKIIQYSVKTGHPYFMNQLYSGVDPYGLVGQWLTDVLNPSVYTYEVSPVFTLMEETVLKEMRKIVGLPEDGDGIFCPGGSIANGYAINCARYFYYPEIKSTGLFGVPKLILFTSEDAHYSIEKLAAYLGIGVDNVVKIKTEKNGKMSIEDLEMNVKNILEQEPNARPFMVSATAGTTVLGAIDPLPEIAELCAKYNMWFHVDAAWGGGLLMSKKYKQLLEGIERADSVVWNPHKLLAAPQQCSTLLIRHTNLLSNCHSSNASYLFQKDKFYDTKYDTGDKHIQCGRRADVLKFWFMWKAKGNEGFEKHIEHIMSNAQFFLNEIKRRSKSFKLVLAEPELTNISFWYVPNRLQKLLEETKMNFDEIINVETCADDQKIEMFRIELNNIAPKIKEMMMRDGSMMVTYQPLHNYPNFFRMVIQSSSLTHVDMLHIIDKFEKYGKDL